MNRIDQRRPQRGLRVGGVSVAWLVPLLMLMLITALDFSTGVHFRVVAWIILVPSVSAAICGVLTTTGYAALSLVAYVAVDSAWPHRYRAGLPDFLLILVGGVLAVFASVLRVRREEQALHMRDIAETTRRTVLRPLPPAWAGLEHAGVYLAADVDARVGGDFYDIQPGPHGTRVLVGDVQGKGLGAVETAAALLSTFREAAYHEPDLATVADRLEVRMHRHRRHSAAIGRYDGDRFATAVLLGFPAGDAETVEMINFGHEPPFAVGRHGVRELPGGQRLPIGFGELVGGVPAGGDGPGAGFGEDDPPTHPVVPPPPPNPPPCTFVLAPDETVLVVTDGVTEARDTTGEFYALSRDLDRLVRTDPRASSPDRLVRRVRDGVLRHSHGRLGDDTTVFAVRRVVTGAGGGTADPEGP